MNAGIEQMLEAYDIRDIYDRKNAMKEIMQEIVLCGLSRANFFQEAAFYGGTALRIFYGLDRFSEDLDFSLKTEDDAFDLAAYFPALEKEVRSFGLNLTVEKKEKLRESNIQSAFLKGNTKEHLLLFYVDEGFTGGVSTDEKIKIKFEIDVCPPTHATFEHRYQLRPSPYSIDLYDLPSLFAGKIHAVICRAWKNRVKGRDLYDYVFLLAKGAAVNLEHLRARLIQSDRISSDAPFDLPEIKRMLYERFDAIDFAQARQDVEPFVRDRSSLNLWSADFFKQITENLRGR